jgi:superfamily II DNA or RNA helicase
VQLRDYQLKTIEEIDRSGSNRVMVHLSTGSGKSEIFCELLKRAGQGVLVVRGRQLVENASQRLTKRGIDHGVIMAGHRLYDLEKPIQVCSIDTLVSRKITPVNNLLLIDEAHFAVSESFRWLAPHYKKIISFTATPYVNKSLAHIADHVVRPITHEDLVRQGYLVRAKYYSPSKVDLRGVKTTGGDYNLNDLARAYSPKIYGDAVAWYTKLLGGKPAVCFAINKQHAEMICERFNAAGYSARIVTDKTPLAERQKIIEGLESGAVHVVVNVNVFSVGVDIPCLAGVILCRPTQSLNWHIQAIGRGTRLYKDKDHFLVLDHANNVATHGFIEDEVPFNLGDLKNKIKFKKLNDQPAVNICEECFAAFRGKSCSFCGFVKTIKKPLESREVLDSGFQVSVGKGIVNPSLELNKLIAIARKRGLKPGWVYFRLKEKFGQKVASGYWNQINALLR